MPAALRRLVIQRAQRICEYCLIHEDDTFLGCQVEHIISSTGRITNRGTMEMSWDPSTQTFTGHWAYHRGKLSFPFADFRMFKQPTA